MYILELNNLDMNFYSMAQLELLTGISAHTLRIWERRYNFLSPKRTKTNIRYYSDKELVLLLNIGILIRNGFKISKINTLSEDELNSSVTEILGKQDSNFQDEINILIKHMIELNEEGFNQVYQKLTIRKGLLATVIEVFYPFLSQIGILWGTNKIIPAQEHFITNLMKQKIITAIDSIGLPPKSAPSICMFLMNDEQHDLGLLLANYIAKDLGWKVIYLGQNVPIENLSTIMNITKPSALLTMLTIPLSKEKHLFLKEMSETSVAPLLISGKSAVLQSLEQSDKLKILYSPNELIEFFESYQNQR